MALLLRAHYVQTTYGFASSEKVSVCPGPGPASVAHKINSLISVMALLLRAARPSQYSAETAGLLEGWSFIDSTT
jgi:hypothetical protein